VEGGLVKADLELWDVGIPLTKRAVIDVKKSSVGGGEGLRESLGKRFKRSDKHGVFGGVKVLFYNNLSN